MVDKIRVATVSKGTIANALHVGHFTFEQLAPVTRLDDAGKPYLPGLFGVHLVESKQSIDARAWRLLNGDGDTIAEGALAS